MKFNRDVHVEIAEFSKRLSDIRTASFSNAAEWVVSVFSGTQAPAELAVRVVDFVGPEAENADGMWHYGDAGKKCRGFTFTHRYSHDRRDRLEWFQIVLIEEEWTINANPRYRDGMPGELALAVKQLIEGFEYMASLQDVYPPPLPQEIAQ